MAKFLGVISNSAPSPSDDHVLEFTDLELLANFLLNETQNLLCEFLQKVLFINDREILILENCNNFGSIYECLQILNTNTLQIERDTDEVGLWLCKMEKSINCMENLPNNLPGCKCTSNSARTRTLGSLVLLSEHINRIDNQVSLVEAQQSGLPLKDEFDFNNALVPFLDLHTKILEQIEQKTCRVTDLLNTVDRMFISAHKKIMGDCYRKVTHDYATDC